MSQEVKPEGAPETPANEAPTDFREYVRWRESGELPEKEEPEIAAAVEAPPVETEPQSGAEEPQEQEPEDDEEPESKPRNGRERRINRLTREVEMLKAQLAAATQPRPPQSEPARPVPAGKPKLESFETLEAYQEALTDWKIDQRDAQRKAEEDRQAAEAAERKLQSAWSASEKTARATHPDYDDVVRSVQAPEGPGVSAARQAMLEEDSGAEILYYLGTHPDELRRIAALSPVSAVREIGKLSARLSPVAGNGKPAATALPKPPPALSRPAKVATESVYDEKFAASDFRGWERARMRQLKGQ